MFWGHFFIIRLFVMFLVGISAISGEIHQFYLWLVLVIVQIFCTIFGLLNFFENIFNIVLNFLTEC